MKILFRILRLLMLGLRYVAKGIRYIVSWALDKIAERIFALIIYMALSTIVWLQFFSRQSLFRTAGATPYFPFEAVGVVSAVCLMFSLLTTIRFRYGDVSERNVSDLRKVRTDMQEKLRAAELHAASLEERLKREKQSFYGMDWVWEIAVAEASSEFRKTFDYFIPKGSQEAIPWDKKPTIPKDGDKRASGSLSIPFKATMSIDLRQARYDLTARLFSIPEPQIRVRKEGESRTDELRLTLQYNKPMIGAGSWRLCDDTEWQLPLWEQETKQAFDTVLAAEIANKQVGESVIAEAERRVGSLLKLLAGEDFQSAPVERLGTQKPLSALWTEVSDNEPDFTEIPTDELAAEVTAEGSASTP